MKLKLILYFIKKNIILNIIFSVMLSFIQLIPSSYKLDSSRSISLLYFIVFNSAMNISLIGYLLSVAMALYFTRGEWYIYYNKSISKLRLFCFYYITCVAVSIVLVTISRLLK